MQDIRKRGEKYLVRWYDLSGTRRSRTCPDLKTARQLLRDVERERALGRDWTPQPAAPRADARRLAEASQAYLTDRARTLAPRTLVRYAEALELLLTFAEAQGVDSVEGFTRQLLADGWAWLRASGGRHGRERSEVTCRRLVEVWQLLWEWCSDHDELGAHTPRPRRLDMPAVVRAIPVAPTWAEADATLAQLEAGSWIWRAALIQRCLGSRRTETLLLDWADVDLDRRVLRWQPHTTKGQYGGRVVPIPEVLAQAMAGWGRREGSVVQPPALELTGRGHYDRVLRKAWARSKAREAVFKGQPTHAFRKAMETALVAGGVDQRVIDHLTGHQAQGTGGRHYLDPRALWEPMVAAVALVPPLSAAPVQVRGRRRVGSPRDQGGQE